MNHLIKNSRLIGYILSILTMLQSCVAYQKATSTPSEAASFDKKRIKIITKGGEKYKLNWIIVRGQSVVSYKNSKKTILKMEDIEAAMLGDPFRYVTIAETYDKPGPIFIRTKGFQSQERLFNHTFFMTEDAGDKLYGFYSSEAKPEFISIPIKNIEKILVQNKTTSTIGNIAIGVGVVWLISSTIALIQLSNDEWTPIDF